MVVRNIFSLAIALSLTACATVVSTPRQMVKVESNPSGAKIIVTTKAKPGSTAVAKRVEAGVTPATVSVSRKDGEVLLELEGYETAKVPLKPGFNAWVLGDVALGSLLSTSIDTSTGASNQYDPGQYLVDLKKKED